MAIINTGPAAVDTGATTITPIGPLDRAPGAVPPAIDPGIPTAPPVYNRPVDRAPEPVEPGVGLGTSTTAAAVPSVPVVELPVEETAPAGAGASVPVATPIYIKVLSDGTVVTENTMALNFLGTGVTVAANGSQANITITTGGSSYTNSNVVSLMSAFGSNTISTTGNITGGYVFGNGSQLTGIAATYGNANVVTLMSAFGSNTVSTTGNITGGNILGGANVNATTHTGTTVSVSANVTGGNITTAGLIVTTGNVSGGNVIAATLVQSATVSASGNITGSYIFGNGSQLTGLPATYGNSNVTALLGNLGSNAISSTGNVTTTANISGNYILGNGSQLTGVTATSYNLITTDTFSVFIPPAGGETRFANVALNSECSQVVFQRVSGATDYNYLTYTLDGSNPLTSPTAISVYLPNGATQRITVVGGSQLNSTLTGGTNGSGAVLTYYQYSTYYINSYNNANVATFLAAYGSNTVVTTGNITGGNILGGANVNATTHTGTTVSVSANITGGNILTAGLISAGGNIAGNFFIGNGSQLTGLAATYGNANVVANLAALGSNPVSTTGNISAGYVFGNGSQLSGLPATYGNANVVANLAALGSNPVSTTGNITGGNILGGANVNATTHTGTTVSVSANVTGGNILTAGLISATGNITSNGLANINSLRVNQTANAWAIAGNTITAPSGGAWNSNAVSKDEYITSAPDGYINLQSLYANSNIASQVHLEHGLAQIIVDNGSEHIWAFDNTGNLALPRGGIVYETSIPGGALTGNTIALKPQGGTNADQQLLIYPTALGADANHLHLTSGNLYNTELFLGNDNLYVKLANTGNIVINTNDDAGNSAQWTFGTAGTILINNGNLTLQTPNGVPGAVTAITGSTGSWESNPRNNLATAGGTGAGLTVNVTEDGGYASAIAIATPGAGYTNGDSISVVSGSSDASFTISVLANGWTFGTNGTLSAPGAVSAVSNVTGGNVLTGGLISATGNISGNFFVGNGSLLTGIAASYGNANVVANLAALGSNPVSTTGNITGGNVITTRIYGDASTVIYNSISNVFVQALTVSASGIGTHGNIAPSGNLILAANKAIVTPTGGNGNINLNPDGTGIVATSAAVSAGGNVTGGNILTAGLISATGNIQGGNIRTAGLISATGNITGGNLSVAGNVIGNISFTGANITINNAPGGNEGAELYWALPAPANTVLNTSLVQDVFQNGMRFFESSGNTRGLYMDLGNAPNGSGTAVGYRDIPQVTFAANTTIAATDAGRHYYSVSASNLSLTIANNTSVAWPIGTAITIVNANTGNILINQGTGVSLYLAGNATSGNRVLSTFGMATIMNTAANVWFINGTGLT